MEWRVAQLIKKFWNNRMNEESCKTGKGEIDLIVTVIIQEISDMD
jgi:hypothetical protein